MKEITEYVEKLVFNEEIDLHEQNDKLLWNEDERIGNTEEIQDTYCQIPSIEIESLIEVLQRAIASGATKVHIYPHSDHNVYEVHGVKIIIERTNE